MKEFCEPVCHFLHPGVILFKCQGLDYFVTEIFDWDKSVALEGLEGFSIKNASDICCR